MMTCSNSTAQTTLPALRIPQLDLAKMTDAQVKAVVDWVFAEFQAVGADDPVAKQAAFTARLKTNWTVGATAP
jgi:hypothetical protein